MLIDSFIADWNVGGSHKAKHPEQVVLSGILRTDGNRIDFRGHYERRVMYGSVWTKNEAHTKIVSRAIKQNIGRTVQQIRATELLVD